MSVTFKQDEINIRERLNALENHRHDALYEAKGTVQGKNILINSDKSVSQRGDFSTAIALTEVVKYFIDRYSARRTVNSELTHLPFSNIINSSSIRIETTSASTGVIAHGQIVEDFLKYSGETVIYTAQVRSNVPVNLMLTDGITSWSSSNHSGNGEWEILSVVGVIDSNPTNLEPYVTSYDGGAYVHVIGDYFEVGNEQLELGDKFTGFEIVSPAVNLSNCQRYYQQFKMSAYNLKYGEAAATNMNVFDYSYPVTMRASPIPAILTSPATTNCGTLTLVANENVVTLRCTVTANGAYGVDNTGVYELDAEL